MALAFEQKTTQIPQTNGARTENETQPMPGKVKAAEVAIKSFKFDYVGGSRPSDIVQVTLGRASHADENVSYSVKTNYSGGTYTGEVTVLVIAEIPDAPTT
jgi:hypothetical protein